MPEVQDKGFQDGCCLDPAPSFIFMARALYFENSYIKSFDSDVLKVSDSGVILRETAFYPTSGGQPCDIGTLGGSVVIKVFKEDDEIVHEVDGANMSEGSRVRGVLDWGRRYKLMRAHTAAHIISSVIHGRTGALITGNQLGTDLSRIDFSLERFEKERFVEYVGEANNISSQGLDVKAYFVGSEEDLPTLLAKGLPGNIAQIRVVDIGGVDIQADGGTHVKNTREIGKMELVRVENKGKNNRRIYYRIM